MDNVVVTGMRINRIILEYSWKHYTNVVVIIVVVDIVVVDIVVVVVVVVDIIVVFQSIAIIIKIVTF